MQLGSQLIFDIPFLEMRGPELESEADSVIEPAAKAMAHAEKLMKTALGLELLLNETKRAASDPLRAVNTYEDMVNAVDEAQTAVNEAIIVVEDKIDQVSGIVQYLKNSVYSRMTDIYFISGVKKKMNLKI